jgi:hypothetical protein
VRHRRGRPFSPLATLDELERDGTRGAVRDMCALELDLLTKGESRFGAHDWIVRQRDQIASWRARIREAAPREPPADGVLPLVYPPGEWPAHKLGYAAS